MPQVTALCKPIHSRILPGPRRPSDGIGVDHKTFHCIHCPILGHSFLHQNETTTIAPIQGQVSLQNRANRPVKPDKPALQVPANL
jgi:hypothetical protein